VERHGLLPDARLKLERALIALAHSVNAPTAVTKAEAAVEVHIADSLCGLELESLRAAARIADMGAGAGFPGLALAAALPETQVDLIESAARKAEFIERLAADAGIGNARAVPARVEEWGAAAGREAYGAVTARALASLPVLVEYAAPLLEVGGVFVAWKGAREAEEEAAGAAASTQVGLAPAEVRRVKPFPSAERRHLHVYTKTGPTPERFPRRPGMARKRPLA
jgi:16S rRNA (guanine527-N7)-methyltransferase